MSSPSKRREARRRSQERRMDKRSQLKFIGRFLKDNGTGFQSGQGWKGIAIHVNALLGNRVEIEHYGRGSALRSFEVLQMTRPELFVDRPLAPVVKKTKRLPPPAPNDKYAKFYQSFEWRRLRFSILKKYDRRCMCCGTIEGKIHVDHIKPLRKNWHLRLDPTNLQVLCAECNHGKGNWDETDFRP